MAEKERVTGETPDLKQELLNRLKDAAPEAFDEGKLDLDKLKALVGDAVETRQERYEFNWAGKRDAIAMLQTPTRATLIPDAVNSVDFDDAQHVFIEGENLEVLKILYRSYFGRVKMIYIDPPYNTGNDFIYPDNFADPLDNYLRITGQKNGNGDYTTSQVDRSGRIHSAWLSMMYPRLVLARQLLREDGVIFISIDDNELHNLRLLMDSIFGEENFVANIVWKHTQQSKNDERYFSRHHNHIVAFRKSSGLLAFRTERTEEHNRAYSNPDGDPKGDWRPGDVRSPNPRPTMRFNIKTPSGRKIPPPENGWRWKESTLLAKIGSGEIVFSPDQTRIIRKIYLADQEGRIPENLWDHEIAGTTREANSEIKEIFGEAVFDTPKPTKLIRALLTIGCPQDGIVLDFFAGSGSTADAVMQQNVDDEKQRRTITIQFPELCSSESIPGRAGFKNIAQIAMKRIQHANEKNEGGGIRSFQLAPSNLRRWTGVKEKKAENYTAQLEAFTDTLISGWKPENVIWEVALREGFSLTARTERLTAPKSGAYWRVTDTDQDRAFTICLNDTLTLDAVQALGLSKDDHFVCRDVALNDTLAANLALQCRLKVI